MSRTLLYTLIAALIFLLIYSMWNMEYAYKLIPINTNEKLNVEETDTWQSFTPKSEEFTVMMPTRPQDASETTRDPRTQEELLYEMYVSETLTQHRYMVTTITYPRTKIKPSEEERLMTRIMHSMVSNNPDNSLIDLKKGVFQGKDSLEFIVETPQNIIKTTTFVDGNKLYIISGIAPEDTFPTEEYTFFLDSFRLDPLMKRSS